VTDRFSIGGGLEHIFQIAEGMPENEFTVFGEAGNGENRFNNLKNVTISSGKFRRSRIMENDPDIIHIHHIKPLISLFMNPFRKYQVPILFTMHGLHIHKYEFRINFLKILKFRLRFLMERYFLKKANTVIAVSREDCEFMQKKYQLNNVIYLTNGVDFTHIKRTDSDRKSLRLKLKLPLDDMIFLTVSRFNFQKGYDILIRAISLIKETLKSQKVRFILVGDGEEMTTVRKLGEDLGVSQWIDFLGERRDIFDLITASDVFILPSRWEGLPIVLLEAGLLKVPMVVSDTYGNREIAGENRGILFKNESFEELSTILNKIVYNKMELERFPKKMYDYIRDEYNLEKMISGLIHIYREHGENKRR
jgi:glycosyltransferase involved in cell wall biosynthesis